MAKHEVNVAAILGQQVAKVSDSDTGEMRRIPIDRIQDNRLNFYPSPTETQLEELMDSIQANGLLEPPTVAKTAGTLNYRLISGHSRMAALRKLRLKQPENPAYQEILCRVLPEMDDAQELSAVIEANRQRIKTGALLAKEAEALTEAYVKRREAGEDLPGRIRDRVAEALQVSRTKLANVSAIKNGLKVPRFMSLWEMGEITESCALEIARMDAKAQELLDKWLKSEAEPCTLRVVREFYVLYTTLDHDCNLAGRPCPNARDMYAAFFKNGVWDGCCGCCAMCLKKDTCEECCSYVEWEEPEEAETAPASIPEPLPWSPDTWQESRELFSTRLRQEREKTGLDRKAFADRIGEYKATYSAWENGSLPGATAFPRLATTLGVSTDYLYGLTDDPTPRTAQPEGQLTLAGWVPGGVDPAGAGEYATVLDLDGKLVKQFLYWDNVLKEWRFGKRGAPMEVPLKWWLRLPPVPESEENNAEI